MVRNHQKLVWLCGAAAIAMAAGAAPAAAQSTAPPDAAAPAENTVGEIVVTAQKREESINSVGLSIQAFSQKDLIQLGITETSDLAKVVTGFNFTQNQTGTPTYTIRGVGFQETSLAASPTVSVYVNEIPLPFSIETQGAGLDVQRVEVLKGPQGTLFGENATGGAVLYAPNRPTDHFTEGFDASYGRFNKGDIQGFVSGPITDTLDFRLAARSLTSGDWQKSYTHDATSGALGFYNARASLQWRPTSRLTALLSLDGWIDHSTSQQAQLFAINTQRTANGVDPRIAAYPLAPHDDRAADWSACVNTSPFDQPFDQIARPYGYTPARPVTPTNCASYSRNNTFYEGSLRVDYDLGGDMTLTSLTSYQKFDRDQPLDEDGTIYQNFETIQKGHISTAYQELRLAGKVLGRGSWIVGGNYEWDATYDNFLESFGDSSSTPSSGLLIGPARPVNRQRTDTYAAFGDVEYPLFEALTAHAGVRYTQSDKRYVGCVFDSGDGTLSLLSFGLQRLFAASAGLPTNRAVFPGAGQCVTAGAAPTFNPQPGGFHQTLDEDNVSWRVGLDYTALPNTLLYANISQGYKSGSFPTLAAFTLAQLAPAKQESLLSYEGGFKSGLFSKKVQLNGAFFYYDYDDKQITGETPTPAGPLPILINVPHSHIVGFELSAVWRPLRGLTLSPGVSFAHSNVDGDFTNFTAFGSLADFKNQAFPRAPELTANFDTQYDWKLSDELGAFVGANVNYQDGTRSFFVDEKSTTVSPDLLDIPHRTLVDLRAGVIRGAWTLQVWGRNITDKYYWTNAVNLSDVLVRYAGQPATYGVTLSWRH